jgi:ribose 5-phosphate isomerase B
LDHGFFKKHFFESTCRLSSNRQIDPWQAKSHNQEMCIKMKVSIGSDHRGLVQRKFIADTIEALGHQVDDQGSYSEEPTDYPDIADQVANQVTSGASHRGVLVCGTGIGMSIAANKIDGIRAALCCDVPEAKLSRQHNDANVLCMAGNDFDEARAKAILTAWLSTEFEGGRHARRVEKIKELEAK